MVTTLNVPSTGNYRLWARVISPSAGKSAFYLQVDSTYCNLSVGGGSSVPAGALTWIDYQNGNTASKVTLAGLTAGAHTVTLAGQDVGVSVDKILLLTDTSCTPTGDGSNCQVASTPTPSPGSTPTPTPTPIVIPPVPPATPPVVSGNINLQSSGNLTDTTYKVDGKTQASSLVDTTKLSDGLHTVTVTGIDANGKTITDSETIRVKNHLTLGDRLVSGLHHYGLALTLLLMLIGLAVAAWQFRHSKYLAPYFARLYKLGSGIVPARHGPVAPPPVDVVYPDAAGEPKMPPEVK